MKLGMRTVSAFKWGALTTVLRVGLQFGVQVALARTLGPEAVGLFAMAFVVLMLVSFLADFGFGWALVQKVEVREEDLQFAFTYQLLTGIIATVALYLLSGWIATFLAEPRLQQIIQWLSPACLLTAMVAPASNLLRRDLDFRAIGLIQLLGYFVGYLVIGLPLALYGAGVWALVAAWLTQAALLGCLTFVRRPHSVRLRLWYADAMAMFGTAGTVFVTNVCNWLLNNLDRLLLGRMTDARSVGHYATAYNLAYLPNTVLIGVLNPTFLAAGARLQDDQLALRRAYLQLLAAAWVLIAPLFALLAVCAQPLVSVLYGAAWERTGGLLQVLAIAMPAFFTLGITTPVLWNSGRKHWEVLLQMPVLLALVLALLAFAGRSPELTAGVVVVAYVSRAWVLTWAAMRTLKIERRAWFGAAWRHP